MPFFGLQSLKPVYSASGSPDRALLDTYCVTCHNETLPTADLVLSGLDVDDLSQNTQTWERVLFKLRAGLMPPPGLPRPDQSAVRSFVARLETELGFPPEETQRHGGSDQTPLQIAPSHTSSHRQLLDQYCVTCHNQKLRTADLLLDKANVENVDENPAIWEKAVRQLRAGAMPPPACRGRVKLPPTCSYPTWRQPSTEPPLPT